MDIDVFSKQELDTVVRVLRSALSSRITLEHEERVFLETYAAITGYNLERRDPLYIHAQDVDMAGAHQRKRLVQLAALAALLRNPVRPRSSQYLQDLAQRLEVDDPVVPLVDALERGHLLKVKLLAMRRAFGAMAREAYAAEGVKGVLRFFGALFFKTRVNRDKLWRYKRLGLLPEGTLGREYWKHLTQIGFGFPGEPGGIPDSVAYHDIAHVLTGHDTTPQGEIQQGCFQGGNRRDDGFFFIQFAILQFHHGVQITPAAPAQTGNYDPEKVLWAIHRGAKCSVDMTHQWNFWPLMPLPLEQAREQCGLIVPPAQMPLASQPERPLVPAARLAA